MALFDDVVSLLDALAFVVHGSVRAHGRADVAVSHNEAGRTLGIPVLFTLLAVAASLLLAITSPEGKWLLTSLMRLFEELRAFICIIDLIF